jgi:hypothetical protein
VSANEALVLILAAFWGGLLVARAVGNRRERRRWQDGPSFYPLLPFHPLVAGGLGWCINHVVSPWGSWAIGAAHAYILAGVIRGLRARGPRGAGSAEGTGAAGE